MKILFLSELFYPHGGGAEFATYLYARLLAKENFKVIVVTNRFSNEPARSNHEGFVIYRIPLFDNLKGVKYLVNRRFDVLLSGFMRKLLKWSDVVYVPRFWFSGIPLAKAHKKPVVTHLHDYIPICPLSNLYNAYKEENCVGDDSSCSFKCITSWEKLRKRGFMATCASTTLNFALHNLFRRIARLSDAIICVSNAQRKLIIKADSTFKENTRVIYNPLPPTPYVPFKTKDFGYFGGSSYLKGFHVLCKALNLASFGIPRFQVHATNFSNYSNSSLRFYNQSRIIFYSKLNRTEFDKLCEKIFCVVVPSIWQETFSYVAVESLLRGNTVIASQIGAIPEITEGCEGVFLFTPGDHEQLLEKIVYVSKLEETSMAEWGIKNRRTMIAKCDNNKIISEFKNILYFVAENLDV